MIGNAKAKERECYCGCGETHSSDAHFISGHDGKLRHILNQVLKENADMSIIPKTAVEHREEIAMIQEETDFRKLMEKAAHGRHAGSGAGAGA